MLQGVIVVRTNVKRGNVKLLRTFEISLASKNRVLVIKRVHKGIVTRDHCNRYGISCATIWIKLANLLCNVPWVTSIICTAHLKQNNNESAWETGRKASNKN